MEPMNLGSPTNSPSNTASTIAYLPSFLMGEPQTPNPRNSTLSPNKIGAKNVSFSFSNTPTTPVGHLALSPTDVNRSILNQKSLFNASYQQTPTYQGTPSSVKQQGEHSLATSGPPTQGLFDSLHKERDHVQTLNKLQFGSQLNISHEVNHNVTPQQQLQNLKDTKPNRLFDNSLISSGNNNSLNITSTPPSTHLVQNSFGNLIQSTRNNDFWVTVYGFPNNVTTAILQHFSQCGTIIDTILPPQNGNWVHIKYLSRLECDKALNYNEKILFNNIMIGVTLCKDRSTITDKENLGGSNVMENPIKVRPLAQVAYKSVQKDMAVLRTNCTPQKSSGLVNKALDLFFGW